MSKTNIPQKVMRLLWLRAAGRCALPIFQKKSTGFYQLIEFNAEPTVIEKLEINFRRDERVIRFLTFKQDKYAAEYAAKRRSVKSTKKED